MKTTCEGGAREPKKKRLCDGPLRETDYARGSNPDGTPADDEVVGLVEATSNEQHNLWFIHYAIGGEGYYGPEHIAEWRQCSIGTLPTVSFLKKGRKQWPVCISISYQRINGHWVAFWYATSQMVDYVAIQEYLNKRFTKVKTRSDATNFGNVVSALERL